MWRTVVRLWRGRKDLWGDCFRCRIFVVFEIIDPQLPTRAANTFDQDLRHL
jgi:hypothetical protein